MKTFVRPREVPNKALRLVVFHHAGGSAATYHPLVRALPPDWELLLTELPGRGKRHAETPMPCVYEIAAALLPELTALGDVPLAFFGHSFGAVVASELARALEREGVRLAWLGLSGRGSPTYPRNPRHLHQLDDDALLEVLLELGGTPDKIRDYPELKQRFLRVARGDLTAVELYRPRPAREPLRCPITAYSGEVDPWAPPDAMRDWARETRAAFALRVFAGGHFYFVGEPFAAFARTLVNDVASHVLTSFTRRPAHRRPPASTLAAAAPGA